MRRTSRRLGKRHQHRTEQFPVRGERREFDHKDILAVIIALFQLFAPLALGLLAVALIVSLVLVNIK